MIVTPLQQISIIGCGWLGFPLAKELLKLGYKIKGSTTTLSKLDQLTNAGIQGYFIQLSGTKIKGDISDFLEGSSTLIINIPPGLRKDADKNHEEEIKHLLTAINTSNISKILFISSISVFEDTEDFPEITSVATANGSSPSAQQLIAIEHQIKGLQQAKYGILRLAGLFDHHRHPGNRLAGRAHLPNPKAPLNLIHKTDVINCIIQLLSKDLWGYTFNACYPYHPEKKAYYKDYSLKHQIPAPKFNKSILCLFQALCIVFFFSLWFLFIKVNIIPNEYKKNIF